FVSCKFTVFKEVLMTLRFSDGCKFILKDLHKEVTVLEEIIFTKEEVNFLIKMLEHSWTKSSSQNNIFYKHLESKTPFKAYNMFDTNSTLPNITHLLLLTLKTVYINYKDLLDKDGKDIRRGIIYKLEEFIRTSEREVFIKFEE